MGSSRQLKILMVHNRYRSVGGEDTSTDSQIALLRAAGHEVVVLEERNERIFELGKLRTATRSVWSTESHGKVDKVLEDGQFDVMHVQNFFPLFSPSIYYAAHRNRVPVVQSLRNFRILCPEAMLYRDGAVCTDCVGKTVAWPSVVHECYRESAAGTAVVAGMSAGHRLLGTWKRRVAHYVTASEITRDIYVRGGWDRDQIDVIPNFVYPDPGAGEGNGGYALYAGRLAPPKGIDALIEAWRVGGIDYPLKIAGTGPLLPDVIDAVAANPLIEYLGVVDGDAVADLMGHATLVVAPTRGIETFGRVVAEAMSRGTPAIVANHGGLSEIVTDGVDGYHFAAGDAGALAERVQLLLSDDERLAAMRVAARREFLARFAGERVLGRWVDLYGRLAGLSSR
ncbi:MAG: glycosyltransferase family 4 protein [bacterium]|nr:glycosyltransferase family 4 protein [bacterium]MCP4964943.1 glycosyltransferase family 4 protein [bacterium]